MNVFGGAEPRSGMKRPSEMRFTENKGQWDERIQFRASVPNGNVILEKSGFYFTLFSAEDIAHQHHPTTSESSILHGHAFKETFVGANPYATLRGEWKYADYANFYIGNDPSRWASEVSIYGGVKYQDLYHGIDLVIQTKGEELLKYDLIVQPVSDASQIKLTYEGVDNLFLKDGELIIKTSVGDLIEQRPYAYQEIDGVKKEVRCDFKKEGNEVSFNLPDGYDKNYQLVIDPNIVFASYTGSTYDNWGYTATYDEAGNMYVGGYVNGYGQFGTGYPTTVGAFQTVWRGGSGANNGTGSGIGFACDMGISKFSPTGTSLIYSTYLGGTDNETPHSLVVDPQGNLIVYGVTYSANYPITAGAYDVTYNGGGDIVVTKLNSTGTALMGSTFVGGSTYDGMNYDPGEFTSGNLKRNYGDQNRGEINVDASNNIYVASCTNSTNFPVTSGAFQSTKRGAQDGCVFKLNSNCTQLIWSSYIGGSNDDACYSLDIGLNGTLYVAGGTMSNNFPTTAGSLHPAYRGGTYDGFVAYINDLGTQLLASSYIGTTGNDQVFFVKLDASGNVYFVGQTTGQYPVFNAPYSNPNSGQFIAKVNPTLSTVIYSTVFGNGSGAPNISPTAFLVDTCENVYVAGWGCSANSIFGQYGFTNVMTNMPLSSDALQSTTDGNDFYFFVLAKNARNLLYGSYYGGVGDGYFTGTEHVDGGTSRFDSRGVIYEAICAGCGGNSLTPTTPGVWAPINRSSNCNELGLKIAFNLTGTRVSIQAFPRATGCVPLTVQFQSTVTNTQTIQWYFGDGGTATIANPLHTFTDTGIYHVMLIGKDSNTCNLADTAHLTVWVRNDTLSANFSPTIQINCDSNLISIASSGLATTTYAWSMGDNTTYNTNAVQHKYAAPGTYTIKLVVRDSSKCNLVDSFTRQVTIPHTLNASFTPNSSNGCIPHTANFSVTNLPGATYQWFFGDGTTGNTAAVSHTYNTAGTYQVMLVVSDTNSCNKIDTAFGTVVTIDSSAHADFNYVRTFIDCDTLLFTGWSDYVGEDFEQWDFGDGTQATGTDSVHHIYTNPGTYTITHFIRDNDMVCKPLDTSRVVISLNPQGMAVTVPDKNGCAPLNASFTGNSGLPTTSYYWFFGDGDSTSGTNVSHTYNNTGSYRLRLIAVDSNTCTFIDSAFAQITVINDSVHASFLMDILNACDSNLVISLTNQSTSPAQYLWIFGDGTSSTQTNENHTYTQPGTYKVKLVVTGTGQCNPVDSATRDVSLLPNSYADFNVSNVCITSPVQFVNLSNPSAQFLWHFGDARYSSAYSPSHQYGADGVYTVRLIMTDSASCNVTDTAVHDVEVYDQPIAGFLIANDTFKFESPIQLRNNSINYNTLLWDMGDGTTVQDETSPVHTYERPGWFKICITASNDDCIDTMCRSVFISYSGLIGVPNAFSPNGDGVNDVVKVEGKGITQLMFRIFNRWGELVFETNDKNEGWNGMYKGVLQEMDAYTYTVQATLVNGKSANLKGNITLLR